jgi:hypothetical protein
VVTLGMVCLWMIATWMVCLWMIATWVICLWMIATWVITDSRCPLGILTTNQHGADTARYYCRSEDLYWSFHMFVLHIDTVAKISPWPFLICSLIGPQAHKGHMQSVCSTQGIT